jgi:flagellar assembly protein FliH
MKPWRQTLRFSQPVRNVRPVDEKAAAADFERRMAERERASYERGRAEGEKALSEQLIRQRGELQQLQQGVLESLRQSIPQVVRECEQALTALALEVARRLVAGLPISPETVDAAVREALGQVEDSTEFHIYLQSDDLDLLQQINSPLLAPNASAPKLHFHRAPEVSRGGCLVKTRFGVIDGRRETKMELLQKSLLS